MPAKCWIVDTDLCVMLGNLMENTLNACIQQKEGRKYIIATARVVGREAIVTTEYSCNPDPDEAYRSGTEQAVRSGQGVPSIRAIARKYNGSTLFEKQGGRFFATVLLFQPLCGDSEDGP